MEAETKNNPDPREEALFGGALQLPPSERAGYLKAACGDDAGLRERVQALLDAHEQSGGLLERPAVAPPRKTIVFSLPPTEKPGDRIGHYKLLQQIGEGGCGVVYMAEQEEPVRRRVALKVIKLGMDTKQVIARFEAERQALALMDHPNIAKVFDAGATDTGRPFFVMELVRGIKITDYCDQNNLSTAQRVELFTLVCRAIQHAHQKGIIHRDIKPSNILVTLHDGQPVPKVIDFGIAKATHQRLTDKTLFTQFEQFIGTPAYMSPEQAEMSGLDIDTRSDIYSLGVLLYELLTSRTPFDPKELMAAGLDAMRRAIREQEPPRPSTRLSTMMIADLTTIARQRHVAPPKLVHLVKGDLDWIVMKALEKDRTRRYETANGFAMDLQRYLGNEPVLARPPSQIYRFQKMVRRNKVVFGAACAVAATLMLGLGVSTWLFVKEREAHRLAAREATRSHQVALILEDALKGVGPLVRQGRDPSLLLEILGNTVKRMTEDLKDQPEVEAELCNTIGEVYRTLGQYDKAEAMHRSAQALQNRGGRANRLDLATSLNDLGIVLRDQGRLAEAEAVQRQALELRRKQLGDSHPDVATSMNNLALVLRSEDKFAEAESLHRSALDLQRKLFGNDHLAVATSLNNLALVLRDQGKLAEAETAYRQALGIQQKMLGAENAAVALTLDNLGFVLRDEGKLGEAEKLEREALAMQRRFLGSEHPDTATAMNDLALVCSRAGKLAEAESLDRGALAVRQKFHGPKHLEVAASMDNLALVLRGSGRLTEAEGLEREALAMRRELAGDEHLAVAGSLNNLGLILHDEGRLAEAETSVRDALARERKLLGDQNPSTATSVHNLVDILYSEHKDADVESLFAGVLPPGAENLPESAEMLRVRGEARARTGRWNEAAGDFTHVLELDPDNQEAYHSLASALAQSGDAEAYRRCCARELAHSGTTEDPFVADHIVRDCLLLPASGEGLEPAGRLADVAMAVDKGSDCFPLFEFDKGLAEYRRGHFADAARWVNDALRSPRTAHDHWRRAEAYLVLAMAECQLKQMDHAREALKTGTEMAQAKEPGTGAGDLGSDWRDWVVVHAFTREARGLSAEGWAMNTGAR